MGFKSSKLYLTVKGLVLFLPLIGTNLILFQNCSRNQFALQNTDQLGSSSSLSLLAPSIVLNQDIPALTNQDSITTSFAVEDDPDNRVKSIICELDGPNSSQVVKDCSTKTVTFSSLADGDYTLRMMLNSTTTTTNSLQPMASGDLSTLTKVFRKDHTPPVITVSSTPPSVTTALTAQFVFTVTDNLSGIQSVVCSLDNAAFSNCVSGTSIPVAIGAHNYRIQATDTAGNVSSPYSYSWTVTTTPVASITLASNVVSPTKSGIATFTFSSSASGSTYQCSVDGAAYATCSSPDTLSAAEGSHSFSVKGIDSSGASSSVSTFNWVVDQTAPSTPSILSNLVSPSKNNQVSYSFSSTDAVGVASYQCSQDGTTFATCTSPKAYTLTDGTKSFYVKAQDAAGNVSGVARLDLVIDTVAPVIAITSTQSTTNLSGSITFTVTENGSGINKIQCSLDSSAFAACTSPYAYTVAAGTHNFQVEANDLAGNVSATVASSWTIAAPAPSPTPASGAPMVLYTDIVSGPNSGGENGQGIYLSVFGKNFGSCTYSGTPVSTAPQGCPVVTVGGGSVANYRYVGVSKGRPDVQQITVQIGTAAKSGAVVVTTSVGSSNTDKTFLVNPGRIIFVDPNGNDSTAVVNDITHPFKTVQSWATQSSSDLTNVLTAWGNVQPGDFIVFRNGVFQGSGMESYFIRFITAKNGYASGTAPTGAAGTGPITIMGYPNENPFIQCIPVNLTGIASSLMPVLPANSGIVNVNSSAVYNSGGCLSGLNRSNFPNAGEWVVIADLRIEGGGYDGPISEEVGGYNWRVVNNELTAYTGVTWPQANAYNKLHGTTSLAPSRMAGITGNGINSIWLGNNIHDINGSDCRIDPTTGAPSTNCTGSEAHGIYIDGYGSYEVAYNHIHDIKSGKGFQSYATGSNDLSPYNSSPEVDNVNLHHNLIYNTLTHGINVADSAKSGWQIWDNVVYNAGGNALYFNTLTLVGCKIYNNTLIGSSYNGWAPLSNAVDLQNNIIDPSAFGSGNLNGIMNNNLWYNPSSKTMTSQSSSTSSYSLSQVFANATSFDFHLISTSPAIDAGADGVSSLVTNDYDITTARPQGTHLDIGAFEYHP